MMIEIGIGILAFSTGLFVGQSLANMKKNANEKGNSIISQWMAKQKIKKEQKKEIELLKRRL